MTKHRVLLWILITVLLAAVAIPLQAAPAPKEPAPKVGQKAGSISALLPVARITRGSGRAAVTSDAKKGDELIWNDLVKTERGGRARITLVDQSILSLGSQADLRIVKHDVRSQQTALALGAGRLRAEVTKIARQGGSFELKTPTAVAGVIGTDFGTDASTVGTTTFLCISGVVQVSNLDPNIAGSVQCTPGMTTSVAAGKPPTIPTGASQEQIQKLMEDTEPALIAAMSPTSSLPGVTVDASITGSKMAGIKDVSISGSGITASLIGTPTDTAATVHLVIDASAGAGPRTITLTKQSGALSAAVFSILSPPTPQSAGNGADPKTPYHDTFEQERQSARAGLTAYVIGVQQTADQAAQQLQQANQGTGLDLTQAITSFSGEVSTVQNAVDNAGAQIDAAKAAADSAFDTQYQTAYNALLQRNPDGVPDDAFNQAVLDIFNQVNATLGSNFSGIRGSLGGAAQLATVNIAQVEQTWMATIAAAVSAPGTLKVTAGTRQVTLNWSASKGATGYQVKRSTSAGSGYTVVYSGPNTSYTDTAVTNGTTYYYVVTAVGSANESSASTEANATPLNLQPPTPAVNSSERNIDLGAAFGGGSIAAIDASNSKAANGASITSYNWVLCDSSYKPAKIGEVIAANTPGCNPLSGYASATSDFNFPTCNLNAGDYIARVTVTDSNSQSAALDVKVHVLPPTYDDPKTRFISLAGEYGMRSINGFLGYFDEMKFPGYTALSENVRKNFPLLASVTVLPLVSTASVTCNDATLSGTWDEKLTYASAPGIIVPQKETLSSVHMVRTPGVGWKITDFQGSNGSIPGAPSMDTSAPDLTVSALYPSYAGGPVSAAIPVPPGIQSFTAEVTNKGTAPFSSATTVQFTLLDASGVTISGPLEVPLPTPLAAGASVSVSVQLAVPPSVGMPFQVQAIVNPSHVGTEDPGNNVAATPSGAMSLFVGTPVKLGIISSPLAFLSGGTQTLQVSVSDAASVSLALPTGFTTTSANPQVFSGGGGTATWVLTENFTSTTGSNLSMTVTALASGMSVPLSVPYSVTPPTFMTPSSTTYPELMAGSTTAVPFIVCSTQAVRGMTLNLPAGFSTTSANPQDSIAATCNAVAGNALTWMVTADLSVAPTVKSTMYATLGTLPAYGVDYEILTPPLGQPGGSVSLISGAGAKMLSIFSPVPGTFTITVPAGIKLCASEVDCVNLGSATQSVTMQPGTVGYPSMGGYLTWYLSADFTAAVGTYSGAGSPIKVTAGNQTPFGVSYSVAIPGLNITSSPLAFTANVIPGQMLQVTTDAAGSFTLANPTGIKICTDLSCAILAGTSAATQVLSGAGTLTWYLMADFTATPGTTLSMNITDSGVAIKAVPYSVTAQIIPPTTGPALIAGGTKIDPLSITATSPGDYTLTRPAGILVCGPTDASCTTPLSDPIVQTASRGSLSWYVKAGPSAAAGAYTTANSALKVRPTLDTLGQYEKRVPYSVTALTFGQSPTPVAMTAGGSAMVLTGIVNDAGTYLLPTTLPTGITASPCAAPGCAQTVGAGGTLNWSLQADLTAAVQTTPATLPISNGITNLNAAYTVAGPTFGEPNGAPNLTAGDVAKELRVSVDVPGTYSLTVPSNNLQFCLDLVCTGGAVGPPPQLTVALGQNLVWYIQAPAGTTGGSFTATVTAMIMPGNTPSLYTWNAPYSIGAFANYVITGVSYATHAGPPYLGVQGFQVDENLTGPNQQSIFIKNIGNASPAGNVTATFTCTNTTGQSGGCSSTNSTSAAAPAVGQTATVYRSFTVNPSFVPVGGHTATLTVAATDLSSQPIPQSSIDDDSYQYDFEIVDFSVTMDYASYPAGFVSTDPQNFIVGSTQQMKVNIVQNTAYPFSMPFTIGPANSNLIYSPTSLNVGQSSQTFNITALTSMPTTTPSAPYTVSVCGQNHGVSRCASQAMNFITANLDFANLFPNDSGTPLTIPVGNTQVVKMKLTTSGFSGAATLVPPLDTSHFTSTYFPGTVPQGGQFDWQVQANSLTPSNWTLQMSADIPNSSPVTKIYKDLWLSAVSLPDLQIVSVNPSTRAISALEPWLSGEGMDFTVTVKNVGAGTSAGGEQVTMRLDSYEVGTATVPTSTKLAQNQTYTFGVDGPFFHAVAPDLPCDVTSCKALPTTLKTNVVSHALGDVNKTDNTLSQTIATSNWSVAVPNSAGSGFGDGTGALLLQPGMSSYTSVGFSVSTGGTPMQAVTLSSGVATTGILPAGLGATSLGTSPVTITIDADPNKTPNGGYGYAQVIAEMKDSGTLTATRQATIHIVVGSPPGFQPVSITTSPNMQNQSAPLQINGPLAQNFTFTATCGSACAGTVDLTFNDAANTTTQPNQFKAATLSPTGVALAATVAAALDPDGNVVTGPSDAHGGYGISATGVAIIAGKRGSISPSPVGTPIPLYVNVGDIAWSPSASPTGVTLIDPGTGVVGACVKVPPPPAAAQVTLTNGWSAVSGFNAPSISWQITGAGNAAITFGNTTGGSAYPSYSAQSIALNATQAVDGLVPYVLALTISQGGAAATKYFPLYVDASTAQNLCGGTTFGARGGGSQIIRGTWSRSAIGMAGPVTSAVATRTVSTSSALPDLRVSASDVSFTPSMPKPGDAVQVRFRVRNEGNADAVGVPIALQINGSTVAIDTFNVGAGRTTLAGLQWNGVLPEGAAARVVSVRRSLIDRTRGMDADLPMRDAPTVDRVPVVSAMVVVDPRHTIQQKSTLEKSAALAHFTLRSATAETGVAAAGSQRILLELADGSCVGLRMTTGSAGPCGSADLEINVDDKGGLTLNTLTGVADMGASFGPATSSARFDPARLSSGRYVSLSVATAGHSYAVQLSAGRIALLTVVSVRNPGDLDARTRALFRAAAIRVLGKIGSDTAGPFGPGEVAGTGPSGPTVFVELALQTP